MELDFLHHCEAAGESRRPISIGAALRAAPDSPTGRRHRPRRQGATAAKAVLTAVARAFKVPLHELRAPTRRRPRVAEARQAAMYLTHVIFSVSLSETGRVFGRDRTTAAYACRTVEDRRDDPAFDRLLDELAQMLDGAGGEGRP